MNRSILTILFSVAVVAGAAGAVGAAEKEHRADPWITLKTKLALLTDADVHGTEINVDTVDGRVTLHGKVESAAEKSRATEIAKGIEGTAEVKNLLQVVSDARKPAVDARDDEIKTRIDAALGKDPALANSQIKVQSVNSGVVLLSGKATSLSDHLRAVQAARRVDGVRRVASEVESPVQLTDAELSDLTSSDARTDTAKTDGKTDVKQTLSDSWITTATKMRLLANDATPALDINVDTDHGVVTLFGVVPSEEARKTAEREASKVSGVLSVVNSLQVVPRSEQKAVAAKDEDVKKTVESALQKREDLNDVDVEVKNGVARLTGSVADSTDRLQASIVVRSAQGVRSVQNDLLIATK